MAFSIIAELSKTPEVFEAMLLQLNQRDLLLVQRVNSYWLDLITHSPALQRRLFFQPIPTAEASHRKPEFNPLVQPMFPFLFTPGHVPTRSKFWGHDAIKDSMEHCAGGQQQHRDAVLRPEASWRRMLPIQPAARLDGVINAVYGCTGLAGVSWSHLDASKYVQAPGTAGLTTAHDTSRPDLDLGTCATMGLLYDVVFHQLDSPNPGKLRHKKSIYVQWNMFPESVVPRVSYKDGPVYKDEARTELDFEATFAKHKYKPTRPEDMKLRNRITVHTAGAGRPSLLSPTGFKILDVPKGLVHKIQLVDRSSPSQTEYLVWARLPALDSDAEPREKEWTGSKSTRSRRTLFWGHGQT